MKASEWKINFALEIDGEIVLSVQCRLFPSGALISSPGHATVQDSTHFILMQRISFKYATLTSIQSRAYLHAPD